MRTRIIILSLLLITGNVSAQSVWKRKQKVSHAKGTLWGYWGYNRSAYTKSNMRFVGPGYDFTLGGAKAHDNQTPFGVTYFKFNSLTVPQFNARVGYYLKNHWAISFGYDHMKYIFKDGNEVTLSGSINQGVDETGNWSGTYSGESIVTDRDDFHYENSDGLNFLRAEITRTDMLLAFGLEQQFVISSNLGASLGGLLSYNDYNFGGTATQRTVSLSGYGLAVHVGLRFEFFKHVFLQTQLSGGMNHQVKVRTRATDPTSFARHMYGYSEWSTVLGFLLYIRPTNSCDSCPVWD